MCRLSESEDVHSLSTAGGGKVNVVRAKRQAVDMDEPVTVGERERQKLGERKTEVERERQK